MINSNTINETTHQFLKISASDNNVIDSAQADHTPIVL
jgi:hypothetical protein